MSRLIFLTGKPGVGKTSILLRAVETLKAKGFRIGGMISREIRDQGVRTGFEIADIETGKKGWLAHINQRTGPRVGKYRVNLADLNRTGAVSILRAIEEADIIVIDEIGPMELHSQAFREAVTEAISSNKPVLGTVHYRAKNPLVIAIKKRKDAEIIEVTQENRDGLTGLIAQEISGSLEERQGRNQAKNTLWPHNPNRCRSQKC